MTARFADRPTWIVRSVWNADWRVLGDPQDGDPIWNPDDIQLELYSEYMIYCVRRAAYEDKAVRDSASMALIAERVTQRQLAGTAIKTISAINQLKQQVIGGGVPRYLSWRY